MTPYEVGLNVVGGVTVVFELRVETKHYHTKMAEFTARMLARKLGLEIAYIKEKRHVAQTRAG